MKTIDELREIEKEIEALLEQEASLWNKYIFPIQSKLEEIRNSLDIRERLAMSPQHRTRSFQFDSEGRKYVSFNPHQSRELRDPNEIQNPKRDFIDLYTPVVSLKKKILSEANKEALLNLADFDNL